MLANIKNGQSAKKSRHRNRWRFDTESDEFHPIVSLDHYLWWIPGLLVWGMANTIIFVCSRQAVYSSVPHAKSGQAGGINSTAQWLGAALSVPALGIFVVAEPPDFPAVYTASAAVALVALGIAWLFFPRGTPAKL